MSPAADRPTLYVDRCLGKFVAAALRTAGAVVEYHDAHFHHETEDDVWIPRIAERGWVILTKDKRIRRRPSEREQLIRSSARVFTLSGGNMSAAAMAGILVSQLEAIETTALSLQPPFVAVVRHDGIEIAYPQLPPDPPADESS